MSLKHRKSQMSDTSGSGTILIREDTILPTNLSIKSDAFVPGWRVVKNLDRSELTRKIEAVNWNFFYHAGEIRATVLGRDRLSTLRRAVKGVLAKQEGPKFNSLEITKAVAKRFLGVPYLSLSAQARHIQESIYLVPATGLAPRTPLAAFGLGEQLPTPKRSTKQQVALIANS
jgi:hypothetical protein